MSVNPGQRIAVVLFNLGGPDGPQAVRPFLENLFSDPAIIAVPWFIRRPLAGLIARLREKSAIANYALMGGGSPIVPETQRQSDALQQELSRRMPRAVVKTFMAMRYWHPMTSTAAAEVEAFDPNHVVLVPLYPQFSTTTTGSSIEAWRRAYRGPGETHGLCCWYEDAGLVEGHANRIMAVWEAAGRPKVRLLFSAHGLPEQIATSGDPYQWQVEATCAAVADRLGAGWDWEVCYQSRVGPLKWIGPSTVEAIEKASRDGVGVLIDPIAFVSEHIETLVELDKDYAELAHELGVGLYLRAPVVGTDPSFIGGLADAVCGALEKPGLCPAGRICSLAQTRCGRNLTVGAS